MTEVAFNKGLNIWSKVKSKTIKVLCFAQDLEKIKINRLKGLNFWFRPFISRVDPKDRIGINPCNII